jgi:hypothetical protein
MRASSSLMRLRSAGSEVALSRSARSKNLFFSSSFDSIPLSISSTNTRFVLVCRVFAIVRTRRARRGGRETLCRTGFSLFIVESVYTAMHQCAPKSFRCVLPRSAQNFEKQNKIVVIPRQAAFREIPLDTRNEREIPHPTTGFGMTGAQESAGWIIFSDAKSAFGRASSAIRLHTLHFPKGRRFRESSRIVSALCRTRRASPELFRPG